MTRAAEPSGDPAAGRPFVSAIIPCRNEERAIEACVRSVLENDYPRDCLEALVLDGRSDDGTRAIVGRLAVEDGRVRLVDNPGRTFPCGVNEGLRHARGDVIMLMGAHADYPRNYVSALVRTLIETGADNVGGLVRARSIGTPTSDAIRVYFNHRLAGGDAYHRTASPDAMPMRVRTVFGGCYRKHVFDKIGFFNESLTKGQDREFNERLYAAGGTIILDPKVHVTYYPRETITAFLRWMWIAGYWVFHAQRYTRTRMVGWRNYIPAAFVLWHFAVPLGAAFWPTLLPVLAAPPVIYWILVLLASLVELGNGLSLAAAIRLPMLFFGGHVAYGFGSLAAIAGAMVSGRVRVK